MEAVFASRTFGSTEQIVAVLKQHEAMAVQDLIRQVGITEQTFYRWKRQCGGLERDQVRERTAGH